MRSKEHYTSNKGQRCHSCSGIYDCPLYAIKYESKSYLSSAIRVTQRGCESYKAAPSKVELEFILKGALKNPRIQ